ncbi:MAG: hypothetical protein KC495_00760 [Dehalococcoidia bacterium]|nr:hypothetical protein [Dehalococcoidia bacterium]MCB9486822.1 hypothetical protein [Thermoflexaceae bacterium]
MDGHADLEFLAKFARAHEEAGFDRVLVGYGSSGPDGLGVAGYRCLRPASVPGRAPPGLCAAGPRLTKGSHG